MRRLRALATAFHRDESGQMAFTVVLTLIVVFMFFALAFDAGLWAFDHRTAQNQAEAAALAAVQELPDDDTSAATARANDWLDKNGSSSTERSCLEYSDRNGDGKYDTVRVCVRRESPGVFASLSGVDFVNISAAATATVGPVSIANVMPWAVVPPDPDCPFGGTCSSDLNEDGDSDDVGECSASFDDCPWGIDPDNLIGFKSGGGGNTGIIDACGGGASSYRDCISGELVSGFFEEGDTVVVGLQGGNLGQNTNSALGDRYPSTPGDGCDVSATPDFETGHDPDGKATAISRFVTSPPAGCEERLVLIPILSGMPSNGGGSASLEVLGVATFGIASWNRESSSKSAWGTEDSACENQQGGQPPDDHFECGMVWGYFIENAIPPDFLLEQISDSENPFAPLLVALID